jgi:predicted SAM-dependent methyltransferase
MSKTILNIAAGKIKPLELSMDEANFLINLDTMYYIHQPVETIEQAWKDWSLTLDHTYYCKEDVFTFMERTIIDFDEICIYRFLEHVTFTKVEYFIYLLSTILKVGGTVDIIVPNYKVLAQMILDEDNYNDNKNFNFQAHNILLTTELLNEPSCPHASIWTPERAKYFFELEGRFKITNMFKNFKFDGREIYMRFIAERI